MGLGFFHYYVMYTALCEYKGVEGNYLLYNITPITLYFLLNIS